ncbi:unnamed protein product [Prunus armeniaca]
MPNNTAAVEEEKPSSSAKKLLNHWLRFSSGLPYTGHMKSHLILLSATGTLESNEGDPELLVYIPWNKLAMMENTCPNARIGIGREGMRSSYGARAKILRRGKTPLYFLRHQLAQTKLACLAGAQPPASQCFLLQDLGMHQALKAPEHSFAYTKKTIEPAFGLKLPKIFDNFEDKPVASGSIAQVHRLRATLRFRYPGQHVKPHSSCHKG